MTKKRRNQPDYYLTRYTTSTCLCGCLTPITGRQIYAKPSCRVAMHRLRKRLESKQSAEKTVTDKPKVPRNNRRIINGRDFNRWDRRKE